MEFETEFDYISPNSGSDSVSEEIYAEFPTDEPIDESLIIQTGDGGEEENFSPDAIEIDNNDNDSEVLFPELSSWESLDNNNEQENDLETLQNETLQVPEQKDNETLSNIYKLLDERIPEKTESESESESEVSETEITLKDIHDQIDTITQYESEQLSIITEIRNNNIISNNNDYYLDSFQIAITSAIFGSILIGLLFRNIK